MKINFHMSRYTILIVVVSVLFAIIVVKAFSYLPETQDDMILLQNAKNKLQDVKDQEEQAEEISENTISDEVEVTNTENSVNIEQQDDEISSLFIEAEGYRLNKNYNKALMLYLDIVNKVDAPQQYAKCYDGISKIYAEQGNYEKAIAKAKLAYKYEPSNERKLALVKLYHKSGDTENEQRLLDELSED